MFFVVSFVCLFLVFCCSFVCLFLVVVFLWGGGGGGVSKSLSETAQSVPWVDR